MINASVSVKVSNVQKDYSWNSSTWICKNNNYSESIFDNLIIVYDEIISVTNSPSRNLTNTVPTNVTNTISTNVTVTVSTNSDEKRAIWVVLFCLWFY